jgi:hypothetical protein
LLLVGLEVLDKEAAVAAADIVALSLVNLLAAEGLRNLP